MTVIPLVALTIDYEPPFLINQPSALVSLTKEISKRTILASVNIKLCFLLKYFRFVSTVILNYFVDQRGLNT